jgi:quinoprotein glucose dehydrogenase
MTGKRNIYMKQLLYLVGSLFVLGCGRDEYSSGWSVYKADAESSSYSKLNQINKKNVAGLGVIWTFYPGDAIDTSTTGSSECNPIIIDNIMYFSSARHRIYAVNATNGKKIWSFDPFSGEEGGGVNRGVTYWHSGKDKRILFTAGDNLIAVNALTGKIIPSFGKNGKVSLNEGMRDAPDKISVIPTSPGIVYKDLLILGTEVSELYGAQPGYERAYNIKTGKLAWVFHTVPKPGETGYDTWPKDAWKYAGGANDWAGMSLDEERGIVFLALGSPSYDSYGADRLGKNLFGNCVVALNAATGKLIWYFQTIHHDLWDYDLPAPPNLVTVEKNGEKIDAVAQVSKVGFLYLLDRATGKSLFPVEERKVPVSDVPGEEAWPTQPFPLKPLSFSRQTMTTEDLSDFSTSSHDTLLKQFNSFRYEGLFTPPSIRGSISFPATTGGSEWGGAAYDKETGILYVKSNESPEIALLQKIEAGKGSSNIMIKGESLYAAYCASCHGKKFEGMQPDYPSLIEIKSRLTKEAVIKRIQNGNGKMPAFKTVLNVHDEESIVAYLFAEKKRYSVTDDNLLEVQRNEQARETFGKHADTDNAVVRYLNIKAYRQFRDPEGHTAVKPPWGTLNAIDLNTGNYIWKVPAGNFPKLQKPGEEPTGTESSPGPIVTKGGLVFLGGTRDKKLIAFDKETGKILWETTLPAAATGTPCTYYSSGKQFVSVAVGGDRTHPGGSIITFAIAQ